MTMAMSQRQPSSLFELQFPQSVGIYNSYADAQKAVDYLADEKFEVQNLAIVGTDLKSVERVLGRRNWGTVVTQGMQSGISTGLLVALVMLIFAQPGSFLLLLAVSLAIGIALGVGFSAAAYAMSRGKRDFTSITQTVATKYEVLCEHKVAAQAREMLQGMPGARAAAFE
jgi:Heat induced stress protein YflT domain